MQRSDLTMTSEARSVNLNAPDDKIDPKVEFCIKIEPKTTFFY